MVLNPLQLRCSYQPQCASTRLSRYMDDAEPQLAPKRLIYRDNAKE